MDHGKSVIIVGAGIAGLCTAIHLQNKGYTVAVIESQNRPGGRVQTDIKDDFLLDRGFQVLLTAYPEAQRMLDYDALDLCHFDPGALILHNGSSNVLGDPLRKPLTLFPSLFSGAARIGDFLKILSLRNRVGSEKPDQLLDQSDRDTREYWNSLGFSTTIQERFLGPFYKGIFLENELHTSASMFDFTFSMFTNGSAAVPAKGMGEIPKQLAVSLGLRHIQFGKKVIDVDSTSITLDDHSKMEADAVVLAVDPWSKLLGEQKQSQKHAGKTCCIYFSAQKAPYSKKLIALKSAPQGIVNNIAVMDSVAPLYAPYDQHLISVSIIGHDDIDERAFVETAKQELILWYGAEVLSWKHLATYHIPKALPDQRTVRSTTPAESLRLQSGVFIAGDHLLSGSIQGAMVSGRLAADAVHEELS